MVDNQKVARDIMILLQTIEEGMEHINNRIREENVLATSYFFDDIVSAITSIVRSLQPILPHLGENRVLTQSEQLIAAMEEMTSGYEQEDEAKTIRALQELMPAFKAWQGELNRCLILYTSC